MAANRRGNDAAQAIRIGLVCPDELRIVGLAALLGDSGFEVAPLSAHQALGFTDLDLVLIDADASPHLFALVGLFGLRRPEIVLLVMGLSAAPEFVERVIGAGVKGYLSHAASRAELLQAIDVVLSGSVWAPRRVLGRLIDRAGRLRPVDRPQLITPNRPAGAASSLSVVGKTSAAATERIHLTLREREVLRLLVQGHVNREIARLLGIDPGTVKAHLARLMRKGGVDNRTALCVLALARGWVSSGDR